LYNDCPSLETTAIDLKETLPGQHLMALCIVLKHRSISMICSSSLFAAFYNNHC